MIHKPALVMVFRSVLRLRQKVVKMKVGEREGSMNSLDKIVLPFKWSDFGSWFSTCNPPGLVDRYGTLAINDLAFTAGNHSLDGIRIEAEFCFKPGVAKEVFLCGFLADLEHLQLFEPFVGNPDSKDEVYHACQKIRTHPGITEVVELFLPEAGWVLPSIWRFLIQSLGLRPKKSIHMPDIIVMALVKDENLPLLFASRPFDYYGNARRLKEELLLEDFFRQLHVDEGTSEAEVQRAYILHCRESQSFLAQGAASGDHQRQNHINRIRQGYQLWTEKLQQRREGH